MIRLLLVDDHHSSRTPLAMVLDREPDLRVVAQAGSLAEAREAIEHLDGEVDLALLDLDLPDGTGTDLIGDLRAANPRSRLYSPPFTSRKVSSTRWRRAP